MKFYIASSFGNYEQVQGLAEILKAAGWTHTYDWTVHDPVKQSDIEMLKEVGRMEYNGVKEADVVIILTPQGRGTHIELGMAIAFNKIVYLCHSDDTYFKCNENTSTFYWLPQIKQIVGGTEDIAMKILLTHVG